jgi:hypothetical protein
MDPITLYKKYISKSKSHEHDSTKNSIKGSYKQNKDVGRFFAVGSLSLQSLPRKTRQKNQMNVIMILMLKTVILCYCKNMQKLII